jgi:hypothetical protein
MGMFAFRRLREREVSASAGASFSNAKPTPKLESTPEQTAPKKRRTVKPKAEPADGNHD